MQNEYKGSRDPRFVARHRGGLLEVEDHRKTAAWAADCAEHVLPIFRIQRPNDDRPHHAIEVARAWSRGEVAVGEARTAASRAHAAAREVEDSAACAAARAAGHAVATAHMADHASKAVSYALQAVTLSSMEPYARAQECRWQQEQLPSGIKELVLSNGAISSWALKA